MEDTTWALIETERRTLADLLDDLTPGQWESPSLCDEWRVRDVAAHVEMTSANEPSVWTMTKALARNRGRLWNAARDVAIDYAATPASEIAAELRRNAASRTKPVFVVADNILIDVLVHGQDIAVPLGLDRPVPPAAAGIALRRCWAMGWPFHARRRLGGFCLQAQDCDWSSGAGPVVEGTSGALLLLMNSRTAAALDQLHGPGVEMLRQRTATVAQEL